MQNYIELLKSYQWRLRELQTKKSEQTITQSKIDDYIASSELINENWDEKLSDDIAKLHHALVTIEHIVTSIPETSELLPCKIYLRMRYILGCTLTEIALEMGISISTLRRIRIKSERYLDSLASIN